MIFTSRRRARGGIQSSMLFPSAGYGERVLAGADAVATAATDPGAAADAGDPEGISVTARWLVLTTRVSHDFARALLPEPLAVADRPQLAMWMVEPLSADSDAVGVPVGRLFAGMSCSCLSPGESDESAFTSDFLVGAPLGDADRDPFALPALPHTSLSLVNGVGGMGFSISPAEGDGRGVVGRVELSDRGAGQGQLTPDWLARQSWRAESIASGGAAAEGGDLVRTRWEVTSLSPIVAGSAVVECADFGARAYDLSQSVAALDARYGFARVAIVGNPQQ